MRTRRERRFDLVLCMNSSEIMFNGRSRVVSERTGE